MTASPGDGEHAAREGYYPDPSIPGYIRYWNGAAWVPGTSRPAPAAPAPVPTPVPSPVPAAAPAAAPVPASAAAPVPGPAPSPAPAPVPDPVAAPAVRADETGPVFLDETSATEALPEPPPDRRPAVWQADPVHQAGFGGPRDRRVSWGSPPEPGPGPGPDPAAAASSAAAAPSPDAGPAPDAGRSPGRPAGISLARTPSAAAAPARLPAPSTPGILSARSPAAQAPAAPAAPAWPDAAGAGGTGPTGLTASWPEATPAPAPAAEPRRPEPEPSQAARPELWEPRPAGVRPKVPQPAADAAAQAPEPGDRTARGSEGARPAAGTGRGGTPREVFERMAERAVRPAGPARRALARAVDCLAYGAVAVAAARPLLPAATAHVQAKVDTARASGRTTTVWLLDPTIAGSLATVFGAVLLFGLFYEVLPTARWGRTPGKKLLGVRVLATATLRPPSFGAALGRWLVHAFLGLPGSLWCLVDRPRRQAWHDKAAGTYVAR